MSLLRLSIATAAVLVLVPGTAGAATVIAAYDRYEPGKGFELGLKDAATGATLPLPAGVNTTADELHPALSADGRFLVFTRMQLQPKLNGDIVPPAARTLHWVDRQAGTVTQMSSAGVGPVFTSKTATTSTLSWGVTPEANVSGVPNSTQREGFVLLARTSAITATPPTFGSEIRGDVPSQRLDVPHAASITNLFSEPIFTGNGCQPCQATRDARYLELAYHNPTTGLLEQSKARLSLFGAPAGVAPPPQAPLSILEFGGPDTPTGHPVPRSGDGYVALDQTTAGDADIKTISYPGETALTTAPAPITTTDGERMPAWSPDGIRLGFVRTVGGQRQLHVFDATPGIQGIVNAPVDLGPDAPSPQTRQFQSVYGGLSIAEVATTGGPAVGCGSACQNGLNNTTLLSPIPLKPRLTRVKGTLNLGIFVARVTGTRQLLGRRVARIRVVGRVPLGRIRNGTNTFDWDGEVNGKRLKAGTYLLTFRALKGSRVVSLSDSIRFKVSRKGKITSVTTER